MKWSNAILSLGACAAFVGCEPEFTQSPVDAGGVSFDFAELSKEMFKEDPSAPNLLANAEWKPNQPKHATLKHEDGVWSIVTSTDASDHQVASWDAWADLGANPDGMTVRVSYKYRSHRADGREGHTYTILWETKKPGSYETVHINVTDSFWYHYTREFKVAPGVSRIRVCQRLDGPGDFEFKDVSLRKVPIDPNKSPVELSVSPHGPLGHTFAVSSNQCGIIHYIWRRPVPLEGDKPKDYLFTFELDPGFETVEAMFGDAASVKTTKRSDGGSVTTVVPVVKPEKDFNTWFRYGMMVTSTAAVGTRGKARMSCTYKGKPCSNAEVLDLFVIPEIKARKPRRYMNGYSQASATGSVPVTDEGRRMYARLVRDAGLGFVNVSKPLVPYLREVGVEKILGGIKASNGFQLGEGKKVPADEKFVPLTTWHWGMDEATCPAAVYLEKPFFMTNTVPGFKSQLAGFDGAISNWEPYYFSRQGCMCDTCCREFAKWAKLDYDDVKKDWPKCIDRKSGRFGGDRIRDFRSWQHGRLMKTIAKYVKEFSGGEKSMGFVPEIEYGMMTSNWRELRPFDEFEVKDYADGLTWINPWGPYSGVWDVSTPYVHQPADWAADFFGARNIRKASRADFPNLKIMSFPNGYQCGGWVVEPEILEMNLDAYFFNGWDASCIYFFPVGYDNRYWAAVARATTLAADYEDFVWDGARIDEKAVLTPADDFPKPYAASNRHFPEYRNVSLLQHVAYERDGKRIVAAFNYRADGPANFTLRFADRPGEWRLSVPAARCVVFTFK